MKNSLSRFAFITLMLCISLFFSCSSDDDSSDERNPGGSDIDCNGYSENQQGSLDFYSDFPEAGSINYFSSLQKQSGNVVMQSASETNVRIVWGNLENENDPNIKLSLRDSYGNAISQNQKVIVGRRTPVYIASGTGWNNDNTVFSYDNDPEFTGKTYSLIVSPENGLRLYRNETGDEIKRVGALPRSGIDTIWVEGGYDLPDNTEFSLNVVEESDDAPSMKLTIYQPKLRFVEADYKTQIANPSGYARWANGGKAPYVGTALDMHIEAYDPMRNELCYHCNFSLGESSSNTGTCDADVSKSGIALASSPIKLSNGKVDVDISGREATNPIATCRVSWKVFSKENNKISLEWTELQFRDTPIPVPVRSFIFDRNGDGIGDSLVIEYNMSLKNPNKGDSLLPILLEVTWEKNNPVYFHIPGHSESDLKNPNYVRAKYPEILSANRAYWSKYLKNDFTIVIADDDTKLSREILTSRTNSYDFTSNVSSWFPYIEDGGFQYLPLTAALLDRISPIVVDAAFRNSVPSCETDCKEELTVYLSEPVYAAENVSTDDFKNPFNYCLRSQNRNCAGNIDDADRYNVDWDNKDWAWELPQGENIAVSARYNKSGVSNVNGDSISYLSYISRKTGSELSPTPKAGDWVKIRKPSDGAVFVDAEGNPANPRERGVLITGSKPSQCPVHVGRR